MEIRIQKIDETKNEYIESLNKYQIMVINYIRKSKEDFLKARIKEYGEVLDDKITLSSSVYQQKMITEMVIATNEPIIKKRVIVAAALALLFPDFVSPIILFSVPSIYYYLYQEKASLKLQDDYIKTQKLLNKTQDKLYEELYILREDYHDTNSKLSNLEKRVKEGEYIVDEAISYLNPNILEEKSKVYKKV